MPSPALRHPQHVANSLRSTYRTGLLKELCQAAEQGDTSKVITLLKDKNLNPAQALENGSTPLSLATRHGHPDIVAVLLDDPRLQPTDHHYASVHEQLVHLMRSEPPQGDQLQRLQAFWQHPIIDPNWQGHDGKTLLHLAAENDAIEEMSFLLERCAPSSKADPDMPDHGGFTPLHVATQRRHSRIVQALLQANADVNLPNPNFGATALHFAAVAGQAQLVQQLVDADARLNERDCKGYTPLVIAITNRDASVLDVLLQAGADPEIGDNLEDTPLIHAVLSKNDHALNALLNRVDVNKPGAGGETALSVAASLGNVATVQTLLDAGADPLRLDDAGRTMLHAAVCSGMLDIIEIFLNAQVDPDKPDHNDATALHAALHYGHANACQALLDRGADPNRMDMHGHAPLHIAIRRDNFEAFNALLKAGADATQDSSAGSAVHLATFYDQPQMVRILAGLNAPLNTRDINGRTPLLCAVMNGKLGVATELIEAGADQTLCDYAGDSPLIHAIRSKNAYLIRILLPKAEARATADAVNIIGEGGKTALFIAASQGNASLVQSLMDAGADPHVQDCTGKTILHAAAEGGNAEVVTTLLAYEVNPNTAGHDGKTALHILANQGQWVLVQSLLAAGADPHMLDKAGNTMLHAAAGSGNAELVNGLLAAGVDPHVISADGKTALSIAANLGHADAVDILLKAGADARLTDDKGYTTLHAAAESGDLRTLMHVLDAGVDLHQSGHKGRTPLCVAAISASGVIVETLLAKGADPNHTDRNGDTPLMLALMARNNPAASKLLPVSDAETVNNVGVTAHMVLAVLGAGSLIDLFKEHGVPLTLDMDKEACKPDVLRAFDNAGIVPDIVVDPQPAFPGNAAGEPLPRESGMDPALALDTDRSYFKAPNFRRAGRGEQQEDGRLSYSQINSSEESSLVARQEQQYKTSGGADFQKMLWRHFHSGDLDPASARIFREQVSQYSFSLNHSDTPKVLYRGMMVSNEQAENMLIEMRSDDLNSRLALAHELLHGRELPNERRRHHGIASFSSYPLVAQYFLELRASQAHEDEPVREPVRLLIEMTVNNGPNAAKGVTSRFNAIHDNMEEFAVGEIVADSTNQYLIEDMKWNEGKKFYLVKLNAFNHPDEEDGLLAAIKDKAQPIGEPILGETPEPLYFPHAINDDSETTSNFRSSGRYLEEQFLERPLKRMTTLDEELLVARQESHLLTTENGKEFAALLRRHFEGAALRHETTTLRQLYEKIPLYAVDLTAYNEARELYRGGTINLKQLNRTLHIMREGTANEKLQLAHELMHGHEMENGTRSYSGITAFSTRPSVADMYREKRMKQDQDNMVPVFFKLNVLGENDEVDGARGVTARENVNYINTQHYESEIVLDPHNHYSIQGINWEPHSRAWVIEIDAFRMRMPGSQT